MDNQRIDPAATTRTKITDLPEFDVAEWLPDEAAAAEYLTVVMEENDPAALAKALGTIARAKGMTQLARDTGIGRESLYKALSGEGNPSFATVLKVMSALGLSLNAGVKHA